jgi:hypothetical protein
VIFRELNQQFSGCKSNRIGNKVLKSLVAACVVVVSILATQDAQANCWKREVYRDFYGVDNFGAMIKKITWDASDIVKVTGTAVGYLCQRLDSRKSVWRPESLYGKDDVYIRFETYWNNLLQTKSYVVRVDPNSDFTLELKSSDFFSANELQRLKNGEEVIGKYFDLVISVPNERYPVRFQPYLADFKFQNVIKLESRK